MEPFDANRARMAPPSYAARLFMVQYNLILFAGSALFSLAAASPLPIAVGAATELVVLVVGSNLPGVRRWLDRREAGLRRTAAGSALMVAIRGLDREYAGRVLALDNALGEIRDLGGTRPEPGYEHAMTRLETLGPVYLGLCETHQRIAKFLTATPEAEIAAEIARLTAEFAAEKDLGLRLSLRQALGLARRRQEHRASMIHLLRSLGVKLESVERSLAYLRSQGQALVENPRLSAEIETLLSENRPGHARRRRTAGSRQPRPPSLERGNRARMTREERSPATSAAIRGGVLAWSELLRRALRYPRLYARRD